MKNLINLYRDKQGLWRWQAVAAENGNILADSGQGYVRQEDAEAGAERVTHFTEDGYEFGEADPHQFTIDQEV